MLPAILHSLAFLIALNVQTMATPFAGAWLFFSVAGCCASLRHGYPEQTLLRQLAAVWLILLGSSCFLLRPVTGGASFMWILAAAPMMAVTLHPKEISKCLYGYGSILTLFALGLVAQQLFDVHYTSGWEGGKSWPVLDPNNAAAMLDAGVIFSFALAHKEKKFFPLLLLFAAAVAITQCKSGMAAALIACVFVIASYRGRAWLWLFLGALLLPLSSTICHKLLFSLASRHDLWLSSLPLLAIKPLTGLGLGTYGQYYSLIRTETDTFGAYAHNDVLQFAIEMGWPITAFFCIMVFTAVWTMRTLPAAAAYILCLFLMSMVEFQFYLPATSMLFGLSLACCCAGVTSTRAPLVFRRSS